MAGLYDSICLGGRDTNGGMVIAEIPAMIQRADGINLKKDTRKAIGNNDTLMSDSIPAGIHLSSN